MWNWLCLIYCKQQGQEVMYLEVAALCFMRRMVLSRLTLNLKKPNL